MYTDQYFPYFSQKMYIHCGCSLEVPWCGTHTINFLGEIHVHEHIHIWMVMLLQEKWVLRRVITLILVNLELGYQRILSRLLHWYCWILLGVGILKDTVKVIAPTLVNIVWSWDIRGHCQGYCTDIGEYCLELGYQRTLARLLHRHWWILSGVGISEDTVKVIALILVNIVWSWDIRRQSRLLHWYWCILLGVGILEDTVRLLHWYGWI